MNYPLISDLEKLIALLGSHPQQAATKKAVTLLDKVAKAVRSTVDLIEQAVEADPPRVQELRLLLEKALAETSKEKDVKDLVKPLLDKLPSKKAGTDYLSTLANALDKAGQTDAAKILVRHHLDRPRFDPKADSEYELLKQIRSLGQMDASQQNAAKDHLLANPDLVIRLCESASIATVKKGKKTTGPVPTKTLVAELIKQGKRYAENASL